MKPSLDPIIAGCLRAFAQRWLRMVLVRGLCAGVMTLLVAFSVIAWLDRFLVLPEVTRWLLSLGSYAGTALVFWRMAGRILAKPPSTREFAVLMEKAWPGLHSHLVAAVELAEKSAEGKDDSFAFRDLVQEGVARRVRDLRMEDVLPRSLVLNWTRSALVCFCVVAGMFAVPALEFPRQFARALVPMGGIERVSRTKIRVIEPAVDTRWLAQGDHQPIVVQLVGADTGRAELEVLGGDGKAERVVMSPVNRGQFTATVPVGQGDFSFRVRAGDALTKLVTIATRARPAVVSFAKTYEAPAYAQLLERQVTEDHGDLTALEGSVADVRMRVNQSVRAGELAIVSEGKTNLITLTAPEPNVVHARIPVRGAATYQVRLVAAETGMGNKFCPTFEIRAEPDLAPRVTLESPRNGLVASPDEVIIVRGTAGDDVGLAAVAQQFQVNDGPWVEVPLALANKTNSAVTHRWDLLLLGLSTGDRVGMKLVAVDLRGTRVESAFAQLAIGAEQSDSTRAKALAARQQVQEALEAASKSATELRKAYTSEAAAKIRGGDDVQRQQTVAGAGVALADVDRQLDRADKQLAGALREADAGRESAELASLASALSAARRELLPRAQADRDALAREMRETPERSNVGEAVKSAQRLADFTAQMAANHNELVAADQADALTERLDQLVKAQQRVQQTADGAGSDTNAWQRVARRQTSTAREMAKAEEQLAELRQRAPKQVSDRLGKIQDNLKSARDGVEGALKKPAGQELAAPVRQMEVAAEQAANDARLAGRELGMRADKARTELAKLTEGSAEKVARLRRDLEQLAASEKKLADAKRHGEEDEKLKLKADADRERASASWRAAMEQLEDRAKAEEARRDGDPQFAAQLGRTRDALEAMRAASEGNLQSEANRERLVEMDKPIRALEAGRQLSELESAAKALAQQERFEANAPDSNTSRPRDWGWMEKQTTAVQREAKSAGLGEKAGSALSEAMRGSAGQQVGREMAERRKGGSRAATPMAEQLDRVASDMERARSEAAKAQAEARQALSRSEPGLSARLLGLSQAAEELAAEVKRVASTATGTATTNLQLQQMALNVRVADAVSAVRRDANVQDLALPSGRERARDADTAVEMLREPSVKAESALRSATTERQAAARTKWIEEAARQDKTVGENLKLMGEHYRNLESGVAEASRVALRKQEDARGTRAAQDERYGKMERLQRLADLPPEEMRRELEAELQRNPEVRKELSRMSRDAVGEARQALERAAEAEQGMARQLERAANPSSPEASSNAGKISPEQALARAAQEQGEVARGLRGAAENLKRAGRNESALGNQQSAQALDQAAQQVQSSADQADGAQRAAQGGQQGAAQAAQSAAQIGNQIEQQRAGLEKEQGNQTQNRGRMDSPSGSESSAGNGSQKNEGQSGAGQRDQSGNRGQVGSQGQQNSGAPATQGTQPDARWVARAFDGLNSGNPAAHADAVRALGGARQAQQEAMRLGRGEGQGTGQSGAGSGTAGVGVAGGRSPAGSGGVFTGLPELGELSDSNWAKLPPKLAQEIREAQANGVTGDYRGLVEAYFKAVAEKARK